LGSAFAGIAAGNDLSTIFWNPAGASVARGLEVEIDGALVLPNSHLTGRATLTPEPALQPVLGTSVPLTFLDSDSGDLADPTVIPAIYAAAPLSERLTIGFGFNGPFGLVTKPDNDNWAGKFEARTSKLHTYNFNPVASYEVTPNLIIGAGVQIEFANASLKSAFPAIGGLAGNNPNATIDGDDFGFGYTLGIIWRPIMGTDLGFGFRSGVEHTLEGGLYVPGYGLLGLVPTSADLETPEIATASLRQAISPRLTLLGTVEWTNWGKLDDVIIRADLSDPIFGAVGGKPIAVLPLNWHDGWFFSGGAEFAVNDRLLLRAGTAYEVSPIQAATERTPRDPDTNRVWLSVGAGYAWSAMTSINLAYSHVFFEDGSIDRTTEISGLGDVRLLAEAEQDVDILALSVRVRLGSESPPPGALK
jgi:long-chain fatty acid transport protein